VADRFIGNRIINSPYLATGPPLYLHGRGAERLDRRATAVRATDAYPGKLLQAREPVAVSIGPQYGAVGPFRPPGATGTRWSALVARERGTAPCVVGPEGKRHA